MFIIDRIKILVIEIPVGISCFVSYVEENDDKGMELSRFDCTENIPLMGTLTQAI